MSHMIVLVSLQSVYETYDLNFQKSGKKTSVNHFLNTDGVRNGEKKRGKKLFVSDSRFRVRKKIRDHDIVTGDSVSRKDLFSTNSSPSFIHKNLTLCYPVYIGTCVYVSFFRYSYFLSLIRSFSRFLTKELSVDRLRTFVLSSNDLSCTTN